MTAEQLQLDLSPRVSERTQTLIEDNRVAITSPSTALVLSDSGQTYLVTATVVGFRCNCAAKIRCCHIAAAAAKWAEAER
jgi:hypothetical protein